MLEMNIRLPRDRFDLQLKETLEINTIWAIMGPSGCGKTSLLRCLAGLESHAMGRITFDGKVWQDTENKVFVPPEQRGIGYIFQESRLFPHLSVMDNLVFARRRAPADRPSPDFNEIIGQLGIEALLGRNIARLSGGEKQRIALARTLLNGPRMLLMDEPLASLDQDSKVAILPVLRSIHSQFNIPVMMVSHSREDVAWLADQLILMESGEVVEQGSCKSLMNRAGSPLANDGHALSILDARVIRHDQYYPLTELELDNQTLLVNKIDRGLGTKVRVVLPAHEISILLEDISETSVQNRLAVTVTDIRELGSHHVLLSLRLLEQTVLALITRKSLDQLRLKPGRKVFAHFKASCLDVL